MTKNSIRSKLEESGITQVEAANRMPDNVGKVGMSFIVTGKVLPTRDGLEALCGMFDCSPSDLYSPEDIDLLSIGSLEEEKLQDGFTSSFAEKNSSGHGDMNQLRVWLRPYEREAIEKAIEELGYRSIAEWLREMIRNTVARNKRLQSNVPEKLS